MMTLPRFPSGSRQHAHHRVEWIRSVDNALAARRLLATAKTGNMPARAETLIDMDMDEIPELAPGAALATATSRGARYARSKG